MFNAFHAPFGCDPLALGGEISIYISYQSQMAFKTRGCLAGLKLMNRSAFMKYWYVQTEM